MPKTCFIIIFISDGKASKLLWLPPSRRRARLNKLSLDQSRHRLARPQQQRHEQQRQHHHSNHHPYIFIFSDIRSLKQHIYIYICNHCNHIHIYKLTYIRASLLTCVLTYTYIHSSIHTNLHIHISICIKMMCVCICVCSYLYFMNTHTHIRTVLKLCHRHRPLSGHGS